MYYSELTKVIILNPPLEFENKKDKIKAHRSYKKQ